MISAAGPGDEDELGRQQFPVEVQFGHEVIPGMLRTLSAMRSTNGVGQRPMNNRKAISITAANCSPGRMSLQALPLLVERPEVGARQHAQDVRRGYRGGEDAERARPIVPRLEGADEDVELRDEPR